MQPWACALSFRPGTPSQLAGSPPSPFHALQCVPSPGWCSRPSGGTPQPWDRRGLAAVTAPDLNRRVPPSDVPRSPGAAGRARAGCAAAGLRGSSGRGAGPAAPLLERQAGDCWKRSYPGPASERKRCQPLRNAAVNARGAKYVAGEALPPSEKGPQASTCGFTPGAARAPWPPPAPPHRLPAGTEWAFCSSCLFSLPFFPPWAAGKGSLNARSEDLQRPELPVLPLNASRIRSSR